MLTDLIDVSQLQLLQETFAKLAEIMVVLVDPDGEPLTSPSNVNPFLAVLLENENGMRSRKKMIKDLCVRNRKTRGAVIKPVAEDIMIAGSMPLFVKDTHLASWIVGPISHKDLDRDALRQIALRAGIPQEQAEQAAGAVEYLPGVSEGAYRDAVDFLKAMTGTVVQMAQVNYDMMQSNQSLIKITEELDSTAQMLAKFTNSAEVGMYVADFFTGELLQANERYARYMGKPLEDLVGKPCWKSAGISLGSFCADCPRDRLMDERGFPAGPVVWERYVPKQDIWVQFTIQAIYWVDGRLAQMVTFTDITQIKRMQEQLAYLAYYDRSMQLPNSLKLIQDVCDWNAEDRFCLICFDIVALRTINDVYSRQTGDMLLVKIARWVREQPRGSSCLYRVDGDEFILMLQYLDRQEAIALAQDIRSRFEEPWIFDISGEKVHIFCSISIGVVYVDKPFSQEAEDILNVIGRTLEISRRQGGLAVYDESMDEKHKNHLKLELSLRNCVKEGMRGFEVYYQPIVNTSTGTWSSLEALCRWTSPEFGPISPMVFIHKAEQMGLIGAVGRWVLETSVRQCKQWDLDRIPNFILDVNLSPAQMTDESLAATVMAILERYDYPGEKLSLEITESTEVNFSNHTINAIERLRGANVQVALDDFGTGYSSFNNLKQLPVSILKTERAFLQGIENDSYLQYLFYSMSELAHAADMRIVAEGVENKEQMRILLKNGVDYLQGYLFSRPLPAQELEEQLDNFVRVSEVFSNVQQNRIDMDKLLSDGYTITPSLFRVFNQCMQMLLTPDDTDVGIEQVLKIVGERFQVSRTYIFWNDGNYNFSLTHEWRAPGIPSLKYQTRHLHGPLFTKELVGMLRERSVMITRNIGDLPQHVGRLLRNAGVKSLAAIPIWRDDELQGIIAFDSCAVRREWKPEEILMLYNLSLLTANVLKSSSLQLKLTNQSRLLDNIFDDMDVMLHIFDPGTGNIFLANRKYRDRFGVKMQDERVSVAYRWGFAASMLPKIRRGEEDVREYIDESGSRFRIYGKGVVWRGGAFACLCYVLEYPA